MFELSNGILKINDAYAINLREIIAVWEEESIVDGCIDLCFMDWNDITCRYNILMNTNDFFHELTIIQYEWESIMEDANMSETLAQLPVDDNGKPTEKINLSDIKGHDIV